MYTEQIDRLDKLIKEGYTAKDINARVYKLRSIIEGPKIKPTEPACINDPKTGELITYIHSKEWDARLIGVKYLPPNHHHLNLCCDDLTPLEPGQVWKSC